MLDEETGHAGEPRLPEEAKYLASLAPAKAIAVRLDARGQGAGPGRTHRRRTYLPGDGPLGLAAAGRRYDACACAASQRACLGALGEHGGEDASPLIEVVVDFGGGLAGRSLTRRHDV